MFKEKADTIAASVGRGFSENAHGNFSMQIVAKQMAKFRIFADGK